MKTTRHASPILRFVVILTIVASSFTSSAHDIDITGVARVFIDAYPQQEYRLSIADQQVPPLFDIARILPPRCEGLEPGRYSYRFRCQPALNSEDSLTFPWQFEGVVALAKWEDGSEASGYFPGDGSQVEIPLSGLQAGASSLSIVAVNYLILGAEHIAFGLDHLLFVLGLILLIKGLRPLIITITAFTVAHSLTLAAAVLQIVPLVGPSIEVLIALSIVFLAREIVMGYNGQQSLVHQKPWLVSFAFGLIHGFGFAGALGELGLADQDIPAALLFFNLGVEVGQVTFILIVSAAGFILSKVLAQKTATAKIAAAYGLGGLAVYWFAERLPPLWLS